MRKEGVSVENKVAFWISFFFLLGASSVFGYLDKLGAMSLSVIAGAIGMAFANLDRFSRIKGAGFEAELKKAVDEAYATTSSVKELSAELTRSILGIIAGEGRWGGMGLKRKLQLREEIDASLTKIGLKEYEIAETHKLFDQYLLWDHGRAIIDLMQKSDKADNELRESLNKLTNYRDLSVASPEEFEAVKEKYKIDDPEIGERISDLKYFLANKTLRRPELWLREE